MRRRHKRLITALYVASDVVAALLAFLLAFAVRFHSGLFPVVHGIPPFRPYAVLLPFVAVLWPLALSVQRLYRLQRSRSRMDEALALGLAAGFATLLLFGVDAYYRLYERASLPGQPLFQYSRLFIATFYGLAVVLGVLARTGARAAVASMRRRGINVRRVLIVGAGRLGRRVAAKMAAHPDYGFHIVGYLDDDPAKKGLRLEGTPVVGTCGDVLEVVRREDVQELVIALPWSAHDQTLEILEATSREYLEIKIVPDLLEYIAIRAGLEDLDGVPVLNLSDDPLHSWDWFLKRIFDGTASVLGLLAMAPLLAVVAILVKRSSPGPVLYRQERLGLDGKLFIMYKFRTMYQDAESTSGPVFAADEDPRCTPVGRVLRSLSLDELPQLFNVARGDMSLVGPRPERPSFVSEFKEHVPQYMLRHKMKSGITGWAQVNGWRGNTSIEKRIEFDLYYLANWSFALDLQILARTASILWRNLQLELE